MMLIAFEGLDQSGKQTQAERLKAALEARGRQAVLLDFPSYETHIGQEIGAALQGTRDYGPDTMQLLYVANRYEKKPQIEALLAGGAAVICDRYLASSIAYGEAQDLDGAWLRDMQKFLPAPDLTRPGCRRSGASTSRGRSATAVSRRSPPASPWSG